MKHFSIRHKANALQCYNKLNDIDCYHNKGIILNCLNNYEEAFVCFSKSIELDLSDSSANYDKGIALFALKRSEEAYIF